MAQFYKKYHRLFTNYDYAAYQQNKNLKSFDLFPIQTYQSPIQKAYKPKNNMSDIIYAVNVNQPKIGRSPALDEFEVNVLPYLKPIVNPTNNLDKLKVEMKENTAKLKQLFNQDKNKNNSKFYQLPLVNNNHQKLYTEPAQKMQFRGKAQNYSFQQLQRYNGQRQSKAIIEGRKNENEYRKNDRYKGYQLLNHHLQDLQRQYMKNSRGREVKEVKDNVNAKKHLTIQKVSNEIVKPNEIIKTNDSYKGSSIKPFDGNFSPVRPQQNRNYQSNKHQFEKKWQIKVLPSYQRSKQSPKAPQKHTNITKSRNRQVQQLYGINSNPYAFANSKLADIKKIERYLSFGYVNTYTQCLYRRRDNKMKIGQRRNRLKALLEGEYMDFMNKN